MKIFSGLKLCIGAAVIGVASSAAPTPVSNVQVTLKGKKYHIDDVTTVSELQERLEDASGIAPSKQGKILHQGKRLNSSSSSLSSLSEAGVAEGDQLNCVPSKKSSTKKKSTVAAAVPAAAAAASSADSGGSLADMMKGLGLDGSDMMGGGGAAGAAGGAGGLDDIISKLMASGMGGGAGGGGDGGMPDMAESMKMLKELTNSPMFSEVMNDPAKLEEARQMILQNPMMKGMMASMPGMDELLGNKDAWASAMSAAAGIMQSMDPEDMMKMMEMQGGAGAMGGDMGMPPGMSGAGLLDELSEGED